jgi:hypothetical protein
LGKEENVLQMLSAKIACGYQPFNYVASGIIGYSRNLKQPFILFKVKKNQRFRSCSGDITLLNSNIHR